MWKLIFIIVIVLKITDKKHSDGLRSGMRIVTTKKFDLQSNLFQVTLKLVVAKYILYVTYQGQSSLVNTVMMQATCNQNATSGQLIFLHQHVANHVNQAQLGLKPMYILN